MASIRARRTAGSTPATAGVRPISGERRTAASAPPVAIIALDGMQSRRWAAPPITSFSTIVTLAPSRAAWLAAVLPAGPPPTITTRLGTGRGYREGPRSSIRTVAMSSFTRGVSATRSRWLPEHRVRAEGPARCAEEGLGAAHALDGPLHRVGGEAAGGEGGDAVVREQGGVRGLRVELQQAHEDVTGAHPLDGAGAVVAPIGGQREVGEVRDGLHGALVRGQVRDLGRRGGADGTARGRRGPAVDAAVPAARQVDGDAEGAEVTHRCLAPPSGWCRRAAATLARSRRRPALDRRGAPCRDP